MGIFNKNDNVKFGGYVMECAGVSIPIGIYLMVTLNKESDTIILENQEMTFTLSKTQIIHAHVNFEQNTVMKNKNAIGRGIVGAALAGTTGAVIGSASAIGGKKGVEIKHFAYLNFYSSEQKECSIMFSVDEYEFRRADKFAKTVNPIQQSVTKL